MSRIEVEVKLKVSCDDVNSIAQLLSSMGAVRGPVEERDVYYSHPCKDLPSADEAIRVRYVDGKPCCLTYKGPRRASPYKARVEVSVSVTEDPEALLASLGFRRFVEVVKERLYADLGDVEVTVDRVRGLGCFVEVESKAGDEGAVTRALEALRLRGERIGETYAEMMAKALRLRGPRGTWPAPGSP